ncbi:hypothetical protein WJX84_002370 [Apatococcus fuscideae]|uniref:Chorein N-terminal domain-containing protein n=1 Tax=Apatococcus fuscideae TaxID=2026836 RepID=A0AAW1SUX4_9CHLO
MFEAQLAFYLNKYLGAYVYGVDAHSLKVSVFKGDVVLENLQLKPEALADLNLPVVVKAGLLGSLKLKVPWASLGKSPVLVEMDRLYILAGSKESSVESTGESTETDFEAAARDAKRRRVHEAEMAWVEGGAAAAEKQTAEDGQGSGRFRAIIDTVIGNLQLSITNVHIRFEDNTSVPGMPLAAGLTIESLSSHTVDEKGNKAFVTHNPLELLRKAAELQRYSIYFDTGRELWKQDIAWTKLKLWQWDKLFQPGISAVPPRGMSEPDRTYVLRPVDAELKYIRRGKNVKRGDDEGIQDLVLKISSVSLHVSRPQYQSIQSLLGEFSAYAARIPNKHLRPASRPRSAKACAQWWHYATTVTLQRTQRNKVYWKQLSVVCSLRKKYVPMYINCLQNGQMGGDKEIEEMDAQLPEPSIKVFRRLAHAKVEQEKRRAAAAAAAEKQAQQASTWWGWATGAGKAKSPEDAANQQDDMRANLTADEFSKLEDMVSEQEQAVKTGSETPYTLRMQVQVQIGSMAAVLDQDDGSQIVHSGMQNLQTTVKLYPETKVVSFSVEGVGVVTPQGTLLETGGSRQSLTGGDQAESKAALSASFVQKPQDGRADAALDLNLGSSYVTYNLQTVNQIAGFFKTQQVTDLSALGAQAVAQIDRARQAAREQLQAALDQKPKLLLHVSLDAPKVAIPVAASSTGEGQLTLVADLGHFTLESDVALASSLSAEKASLYECLKLDGRDLSAYLVDGEFSFTALKQLGRPVSEAEGIDTQTQPAGKVGHGGTSIFVPLLDRCGLKAALQAARYPHPSFPQIQTQLQVASLNFFFSPARMARLMRVLKAALPASEEQPKDMAAGSETWRVQAEHTGAVRVLQWAGISGTNATWPKRWACIHKGTLYLLEDRKVTSPTLTCSFWTKRQILRAPAEACGGLEHIVALLPENADIAHAAENPDAILLRLHDHAEAEDWMGHLRASQRSMREMVGGINEPGNSRDGDDWDAGSSASAEAAEAISPQPGQLKPQNVKFVVSAELGELALHVSGRPPEVWQVPKAGGAAAANSTQDGPEQEEFYDAQASLGRGSMSSHATAGSDHFEDAEDGTERDREIAGSASNLPGAPRHHAWVLEFKSWKPDSPEYAGLDAELQTRLTTLLFFCNRPTVAALMCFGDDLTAALKAGQPAQPAPARPRQLESQESISDLSSLENAGDLVKSGGEERTLMRVIVAIEKLEATLQYEGTDTPPMALASVEDLSVSLNVHPSTLQLQGSLGNLCATDTTLPEGHPYRDICTIRKGAESSLIELEFTSHRAHEAQAGQPVDLGSLHLTNTVRFVKGSLDKLSQAVIVEHDSLIFKDISAAVSADGKRGNNIIRDNQAAAAAESEALRLGSPGLASIPDTETGDEVTDLDQPSPAPSEAGEDKGAAPERTSTRVLINIGTVDLELLRTTNEPTGAVTALAHFSIKTIWMALRLTGRGSMYLSLSVPQVQATDARPWVPEEHSLVISSAHTSMDGHGAANEALQKPHAVPRLKPSFLMLEFEQHPARALQKIRVTLQRPTVVAEIGFLLAVTKFFVPTMAISGVSPIPFMSQDIYLEGKEHKAESDVWLSPECRLLADAPDVEDFVYNGQGHRLLLPEGIQMADPIPLIVVGSGKTLILKNVKVIYASSMHACIELASGSQVIAHPEDNVEKFEGMDPAMNRPQSGTAGLASSSMSSASRTWSTGFQRKSLSQELERRPAPGSQPKASTLQLSVAAVGMGLRFVELEQTELEKHMLRGTMGQQKPVHQGSKGGTTRMLAAYLDAGARMEMQGDRQKIKADLRGLRIETQTNVSRGADSKKKHSDRVHGTVLEPCKISMSVDMAKGAGDVHLHISDVHIRVSPDVLELGASLQASVLEPLIQPSADRPLSKCNKFGKLWSNTLDSLSPAQAATEVSILGSATGATFWRPKPAVGYVALGDCVTSGSQQPAFQVISVAVNSGIIAYPVKFKSIYSSAKLSLWQPEAPEGYIAGSSSSHDLMSFDSGHLDPPKQGYVWCVENCAASFVASADGHSPPSGMCLDLRSPLGVTPAALPASIRKTQEAQLARLYALDSAAIEARKTRKLYEGFASSRKIMLKNQSQRRLRSPCVDFERIWSTFVLRSGDVSEQGPDTIPLTKAAQNFQLIWRDESAAPQHSLGIYKPIAPPGELLWPVSW